MEKQQDQQPEQFEGSEEFKIETAEGISVYLKSAFFPITELINMGMQIVQHQQKIKDKDTPKYTA